MPGSWSKQVKKSPSGVIYSVGATGLKPNLSKVAMVAEIGPRTISHLCFAAATMRYVLAHHLLIVLLVLAAALFQMPIQALICSSGIETLGSACAAVALLFLEAQASKEVLHALAPAIPVASVMDGYCYYYYDCHYYH